MRVILIVLLISVLMGLGYFAVAQQTASNDHASLSAAWKSVVGKQGDFEPLNSARFEGFVVHNDGTVKVISVGSDHVVLGHDEGVFIYPFNKLYLYIPNAIR